MNTVGSLRETELYPVSLPGFLHNFSSNIKSMKEETAILPLLLFIERNQVGRPGFGHGIPG